jgi:hypothetical protein
MNSLDIIKIIVNGNGTAAVPHICAAHGICIHGIMPEVIAYS